MHFRILVILGVLPALLSFSSPAARAYCGDGTLEGAQGEQCDDGNFTERDGCNSYCAVEDLAPPAVANVSIVEGASDIPTTTDTITVTFSEPITPASVTKATVLLRRDSTNLNLELSLDSTGRTLTIRLPEPLASLTGHSLLIQGVSDVPGNPMTTPFIRTFTTAVHVDKTPPHVVSDPPAGEYNFPQNVSLIAYLSETQRSLDSIDAGAKIYYTLDGSYPTSQSPLYTTSFTIDKHTTLSFFGIDAAGNRGRVFSQIYRFSCKESLNAKRMSPYPICTVQECNRGFFMQNGLCVSQINSTDSGNAINDENAFDAPLFPSDALLTVSSKPAIRITPQHKGVIRRPILFKNPKADTEVRFEKDTVIKDAEGKAFAGLLTPPVTRFIKEFPINFGYSFKSIQEFSSPDGRTLYFSRPYKLIVPIVERFMPGEPVTVFTFNPQTEQYKVYDPSKVDADFAHASVTILASKTELFFIAQAGTDFTEAVFSDMEKHWAKNYAEGLYRRGIIKGRSKGVFAPDSALNRAEFTKIAIEAIGEPVANEDEIEDTYFPDVNLYAWYTPYVNKAKELGLIQGYADGTFRPEQPINRAEAIKILLAAFRFDISTANTFESEAQFADIQPTAWYYPFLNFAVKQGLLGGIITPNGTVLSDFGPGRAISRGEMAKLALKAIELSESRQKQ